MTLPNARRRCSTTALWLAAAVVLISASAAAQSISGTVRDVQAGILLRSMVVAVYTTSGTLQASVTTDTSGRYEIALPPGRYRVLAYDPSGIYATQFAGDAPSFEETPETVIAGLESVSVNFNLNRGGTVAGVLLTSGGLRPGMTVAAYNLSGSRRGFTTTNGSGGYSLVLPPGSYKIAAYDDAGAFVPAFFRDRSSFAEADVVTVTAARTIVGVDLFLQLGARVSGTVSNSSGAAVAGVSVLVYLASGTYVTFATTGTDGHFTLTLGPGNYRFVAVDSSFTYAAGFLADASSFETSPVISLASGQTRNDLSFRLDIGGLVEGRVIDATTGAPIAGIVVAAYNNDGTMRTFVTTDANGRYVLLLPSGNFKIGAFDPAQNYATEFHPQQVSFALATAISSMPGQTLTLPPFLLLQGGRLSGVVTDLVTGARISGAGVSAYTAEGNLVATTTTSAAGAYRLVLPPGTYRVIGFDPQLRYAPAYPNGATSFDTAPTITITANVDATTDLALPRGTIVNGRVVDEAGRPAEGFEVSALDLTGRRVGSAITARDGSFQLALVPGAYKFVAVDPAGRYDRVYYGGASFADAAIVTVAASGAPRLTLTIHLPARRRIVRR